MDGHQHPSLPPSMFRNLALKLADRDYITYAKILIEFGQGEDNFTVRFVVLDFSGKPQQELRIADMQKNAEEEPATTRLMFFSLYVSYMVVWLGEMIDQAMPVARYSFPSKLGKVLRPIFQGTNTRLSDVTAHLDPNAKFNARKSGVEVLFKISKSTKVPLVRVVGIPFEKSEEAELYLFAALALHMCQNYSDANQILEDGCARIYNALVESKYELRRPAQELAYEVIAQISERMMSEIVAEPDQ